MRSQQVKVGDAVQIETPWADADYPDCRGVVFDLRHGGAIALIDADVGRSPRTLHVNYLR